MFQVGHGAPQVPLIQTVGGRQVAYYIEGFLQQASCLILMPHQLPQIPQVVQCPGQIPTVGRAVFHQRAQETHGFHQWRQGLTQLAQFTMGLAQVAEAVGQLGAMRRLRLDQLAIEADRFLRGGNASSRRPAFP